MTKTHRIEISFRNLTDFQILSDQLRKIGDPYSPTITESRFHFENQQINLILPKHMRIMQEPYSPTLKRSKFLFRKLTDKNDITENLTELRNRRYPFHKHSQDQGFIREPHFFFIYRKVVYVIILFISAFLAPPEIISQLFISFLFVGLYEIFVFFCFWYAKLKPTW